MEKVLILTDVHIKKDNFELICDIFKQAKEICIERRINTIIIAGDIFTVRSGLSLEMLLGFQKILEFLKGNGLEIVAIAGNHDKTNLSSEKSYLDIFINSGLEVKLSQDCYKFGKLSNIHFLPYFPEDSIYKSQLIGIIENIDDDNHNTCNRILITHASISGVKNNDGSVVNNSINKSSFDKFDLVLVGHYHNRSKISKKIHYIGSSMPQSFGEDNEKGFLILSENLEMEYLKPNFPHYIIEYFDCDDENYKKNIEKAIIKYKSCKDIIRFVFSGKKETLEKIDKTRFISLGISVVFENIHIIKNIEFAREKVVKYDNAALLKEFFAYCKEVQATTSQSKKGLKYFREALNVSNKNS